MDKLRSLLRTPLQRAFGGASLLQLNARQLARPSYSTELEPYLRHDGFYLPSVLNVVLAEDPERIERILDTYAPWFPPSSDFAHPVPKSRFAEEARS